MTKKIWNKSDTASKNNKQSRFNSLVVSWFPWLAIPWLAASPSDHVSQNAYWKKSNFMNIWGAQSPANAQWLPAEFFPSKTTPFKGLSKRTNKFSKVRLLPKKCPGKRNIVSDCKSMGKKEPSFNILFLAKNIVDPGEIYMDGIRKWSLTTGLRFIGYVGIGKFWPFSKNLHFFDFHSKKCSFKANASHDKFFVFWRKQIMSINQAYDRPYSDKVSKFWFWVDFQLCSILTGSDS